MIGEVKIHQMNELIDLSIELVSIRSKNKRINEWNSLILAANYIS